jgi:hypothetical protein
MRIAACVVLCYVAQDVLASSPNGILYLHDLARCGSSNSSSNSNSDSSRNSLSSNSSSNSDSSNQDACDRYSIKHEGLQEAAPPSMQQPWQR